MPATMGFRYTAIDQTEHFPHSLREDWDVEADPKTQFGWQDRLQSPTAFEHVGNIALGGDVVLVAGEEL
jgi:hypothetical protein